MQAAHYWTESLVNAQLHSAQSRSCNVECIFAAGVDYISEFRFSSGCVEHVCNLCEVSLSAPVCLTEHASSLRHLLRFIVRISLLELRPTYC